MNSATVISLSLCNIFLYIQILFLECDVHVNVFAGCMSCAHLQKTRACHFLSSKDKSEFFGEQDKRTIWAETLFLTSSLYTRVSALQIYATCISESNLFGKKVTCGIVLIISLVRLQWGLPWGGRGWGGLVWYLSRLASLDYR